MAAASSTDTLPNPNNKLLRECPHHLIVKICQMLDGQPKGGCEHLAAKLHYTTDDLQDFAVHANAKREMTCQVMLQDWQQREGATLFALEAALRDIGRHDVVRRIREILAE